MAANANANDSHRKHRRSSSPDESEKSAKRHKHCHHHRRHRHGSKKHAEESKHGAEIVAASPSKNPLPDSGINRYRPDDDVEEGEILEEEAFGGDDGRIGKKQVDYDGNSSEIKLSGASDHESEKRNPGPFSGESEISTRNISTRGEDINSDRLVTIQAKCGEDKMRHHRHSGNKMLDDLHSPNHSSTSLQDVITARFSSENLGNRYLDLKYSKDDKRKHRELGCPIVNGKGKSDYDGELEVDGGILSTHRNSPSQSTAEKQWILGHSPSYDRYSYEFESWRGSRLSIRSRERSCSHGIIEEDDQCRRDSSEQESFLYSDKLNTEYDLEEGRHQGRRERWRGCRGSVGEDRRERSASYRSRYSRREDRHQGRETLSRDKSMERYVDKDIRGVKERRSMDREMERAHRREKKQESSTDREMDHVSRRDKKRGRSWERDMKRDIELDRIREGKVDRDRRGGNRRDRSWDAVSDRDWRRERGRSRDKTRGVERDREERDWNRERHGDRNTYNSRDVKNDKWKYLDHDVSHGTCDKHKHSSHSRRGETEYISDRRRDSNMGKVHISKRNSLEGGEEKVRRDEDEQEELEDNVYVPLAEQEEEDLYRIKEESRKRREAILEKYKSQQQTAPHSQDEEKITNKEPDDVPGTIPEVLVRISDGVAVYVADTSFSVGKSPSKNGNAVSERISVAGGLGEGTPKSERSDDMFCDDIFGETPTGVRKLSTGDALRIEKSGLHDNWDDPEGYYNYRFGEILDGRYEVTAAHGRGVFSSVVRARNLETGKGEPEEVAIKIIRNNDTMYKAGMNELVILKKLVGADPDDKRHCVRFLSNFKYRNHLCLVFESLNMNLREVLKKFGRNIGLSLNGVRAYAKQLFMSLKHLRNCGVLHCDIKPDNMLVNEAKNVLKLCDFGNAMFSGKNEVTPYLVSRFYRAPEIILGLPYDHPLDMWSVGCCLYELYTGKVLFPGPTNNDMLRLHMQLKGTFPKKMLRKGAFTDNHFDQDLNFHATEEDPVTKKTVLRLMANVRPKDIGSIINGSAGEDPKMLANFKDLVDKIFILDPDKRLTVSQALNHPFISGK